jgi:hypothetical protein
MLVLAIYRMLVKMLSGRYRPERHYMRGPGPKCLERHSSDRARRRRG